MTCDISAPQIIPSDSIYFLTKSWKSSLKTQPPCPQAVITSGTVMKFLTGHLAKFRFNTGNTPCCLQCFLNQLRGVSIFPGATHNTTNFCFLYLNLLAKRVVNLNDISIKPVHLGAASFGDYVCILDAKYSAVFGNEPWLI